MNAEPGPTARGERYMTPPIPDRARCPHCGSPTVSHAFTTPDGLRLETHHCPAHGPVCPARVATGCEENP